ncbi:MAG: ion channel [Methylococcales bacterium]|nr:ion channel [Methylococcales bacterium]
MWSAWVTMTHVGFGDVVPTSFLGRLFSAGLILC